MPKIAVELSEVAIRKLKHGTSANGIPYNKKYPVGGAVGLYLQCCKPSDTQELGSRQWLYRAKIGNKRRWIGLGGYPSVPTKKAREAARALRDDVRAGIDPVAAKLEAKSHLIASQSSLLTFRDAAKKYVNKRSQEFKTAKQTIRLRSQLDKYVYPYIGNMQVKDIQSAHLISMLQNYYHDVPDTAIRVINHVEKIIQQAIIEGKRTDHNPAIWHKNLSTLFPAKEKIKPTRHHPFVPWQTLPKFMQMLTGTTEKINRRPEYECLAFIILTVARASEARLIEWQDVDLERKIWTIEPSNVKGEDRRKSNKQWLVPLTDPAIRILCRQPSFADKKGRIFARLDGGEIPDSYFGSNINRELGFDGDTHGFRTTFKMWCQDFGVNEETSELALKHTNTNATRAAYARSQLLKERAKLLSAYSKYAMTGK